MKRICAWCEKNLGETDSGRNETLEEISHGICDTCIFHLKASTKGVELSEYIENFPKPIILSDAYGMIINANRLAREQLNMSGSTISQLPPGKVFECRNAFSKEGCGHTEHCGTCCLRRIIVDTLENQQKYIAQKVIIDQQKEDAERRMDMEISTMLVSGVVFMQIKIL